MGFEVFNIFSGAPASSGESAEIGSEHGASLIEGKHGVEDFFSLRAVDEFSVFLEFVSGADLDVF